MLKGVCTGLRAIERQDLPQLLEWRNRPDFRRYFREYRELGLEQQEAWYQKHVLNDPSTRMFAIVDLDDGRLLGACGLCYIDWVNRSGDFSIYIGADGAYIDHAYAPDAARLLLAYGFDELNLHRVWAEIYSFDAIKTDFLKSIGFRLEGRHRQTHWSEGKWCDSLFFGLLAKEWAARRKGAAA